MYIKFVNIMSINDDQIIIHITISLTFKYILPHMAIGINPIPRKDQIKKNVS